MHVITQTVVRPEHDFTVGREEWERRVFDAATRFSVVEMRGRGTRTYREFLTFPEARSAATDRSVIYAAAPSGRSIVLDHKDWDAWLTRWVNTQQRNQIMDATNEVSVFLLHWNGAGPSSCEVLRFASRIDADAYAYEQLPGDRIAHVVESESDLSDRTLFSTSVLVAIHNRITDASITEFESRDVGRARVFRDLRDRYNTLPLTVVTTPESETPTPATTGKPKKERKTVSETTSETTETAPKRRGKPSPIAHDAIVTIVRKENPKRPGTGNYDRYNAMLRVMGDAGRCTVEQARKAGVTLGDLIFNQKHNFITIDAQG